MQLPILQERPSESRSRHERRLRCPLRGSLIVDELPPRCPLRAARPNEAMAEMQDLAWTCIGRWHVDLADGLDLHSRYEVCSDCVAAIRGHPKLRQLRAAAGLLP